MYGLGFRYHYVSFIDHDTGIYLNTIQCYDRVRNTIFSSKIVSCGSRRCITACDRTIM